jgi:glutamate 5-kinase
MNLRRSIRFLFQPVLVAGIRTGRTPKTSLAAVYRACRLAPAIVLLQKQALSAPPVALRRLSKQSNSQQRAMASPELSQFRRIVVKVGSALLVDSDRGEVRASWLAALAEDMAKLHREGRDILVVSSGSIALGRSRLKLPRGPLKLEESQAAAAVGQIELARIWSEVLGAHGIGAGQILVTLQDTEERRR